MVRKTGLFLIAQIAIPVAIFLVATTLSPAQSMMTHHVREAARTGRAKSLARLSKSQVLQLNIVLPLRDQAGLDSFLKDLYNPASPN